VEIPVNNHKLKTVCFCLAVLAAFQSAAFAHAFLDHADPAVGSKLDKPPSEIKIWFTQEIEPAFSKIEVTDSDGKQIDKKDVHIDEKDNKLLLVSLPKLLPGAYKVSWHVVSVDTHKTQGDFKFEVQP
jgi:methionine-rich copper-binding protein CopC